MTTWTLVVLLLAWIGAWTVGRWTGEALNYLFPKK